MTDMAIIPPGFPKDFVPKIPPDVPIFDKSRHSTTNTIPPIGIPAIEINQPIKPTIFVGGGGIGGGGFGKGISTIGGGTKNVSGGGQSVVQPEAKKLYRSEDGKLNIEVPGDVYWVRGYEPASCDGMNKIRDSFGETNLVWNSTLASGAENWALHLASQSKNSAQSLHSDTEYGENVFVQSFAGLGSSDFTTLLKVAYPLWNWYKEILPEETVQAHCYPMIDNTVTEFGIGTAYCISTKLLYFVGWFRLNVSFDQSKWTNLLSNIVKEKELSKVDELFSDAGKLTFPSS